MNKVIEDNHLIFKFNGGAGAVLCSNCRKIIYSGKNIPEEILEGKDTSPKFCSKECENEFNSYLNNKT